MLPLSCVPAGRGANHDGGNGLTGWVKASSPREVRTRKEKRQQAAALQTGDFRRPVIQYCLAGDLGAAGILIFRGGVLIYKLMSQKRSILVGLLALPLLFGNILLLQRRIDQALDQMKKAGAYHLRPPNAAAVKVASIGYSDLVADAYWIQAIQYAGTMFKLHRSPQDLIPTVDFITDLDPRFEMSYVLIGSVLAIEGGNGQAIERILKKGCLALPNDWKLFFYLGFTQYYLLREYPEAADNLDVAAKLSGYLNYALLASRIRAEGGNPELSIAFLEHVLDKTEDPVYRRNIEQRIRELMVLVQLNFLNQKLARYQELEGKPATGWQDLDRAGVLHPAEMPAHPLGGTYSIDPNTGRAKSSIQVHEGIYRRGGK